MRCIELLNEEHCLVLRLLKLIKAMGREAASKQTLAGNDIKRVVDLLDAFLDSAHELKEESALFPVLIQRAGPEAHEKLKSRVFEHDQERSLSKGMREAISTRNDNDLAWCAERLTDFLAEHVREEYLLFGEFQSLLESGDDVKIVREFNKIDATLRPNAKEVSAIVEELETKYPAAA